MPLKHWKERSFTSQLFIRAPWPRCSIVAPSGNQGSRRNRSRGCPPWTPSPVLLAGVGERAPGIHLSSGDKSFNGAAVTVRLRMRKLQLSISAQGSDQNKHAQIKTTNWYRKEEPRTNSSRIKYKDSTLAPVAREIVCSCIYRFHVGEWAQFSLLFTVQFIYTHQESGC